MSRQYGPAAEIAYEEGHLSFRTGHFDMDMIKQAITHSRRDTVYDSLHLQPLVMHSGAWLSLRLQQLQGWNQGLFSLDGGTLVIHPAAVDTVTMLPIDIRSHGGSLPDLHCGGECIRYPARSSAAFQQRPCARATCLSGMCATVRPL